MNVELSRDDMLRLINALEWLESIEEDDPKEASRARSLAGRLIMRLRDHEERKLVE